MHSPSVDAAATAVNNGVDPIEAVRAAAMIEQETAKPGFTFEVAELEEMARLGTVREYRPRTMLVSEGERTDALYIILEGRVRVFVSSNEGREVVLAVMGRGEYFGELAFDEGPRSASVVTVERSRLLVVPRAEFTDFVRRSPAFAMHFIHHLIGRIRTLTTNVRNLALMDAYGRVARLLLEMAIKKDGLQYVPERLSQSEIASRVGCSREMVSRIFKDLVKGDYIRLEPGRIVINREPPARW